MTEQQGQTPQIKINNYAEQITADRFAGKTIIVTGAASGIGRATTLRIAREGGKVIAADISTEALDKLVAEGADLDIVPVAGNIALEEDIAKIVEAAEGKIDGLANNAGIMDHFLPVDEVTDEMWDRVMDINVTGVMRLMRAVIPVMLEAGKGSIVNVTSMGGLGGGFAGVAYTASKHAVVGITKNTAVLYGGDGIRCNAVAPGGVITNVDGQMGSERSKRVLGPLMFMTNPGVTNAEGLAAPITWLLSDDSANSNGAILTSDAGWKAI